MKTLFITDLDGTLLNDNAELSEYSARTLRKLILDGALFTVATARTNATVNNIFHNVGLRLPMVLMNGVLIYDPVERKSIKHFEITKKQAASVLEAYKLIGTRPMLYFLRDGYLEIAYSGIDNPYQQKYVDARDNLTDKRFTACTNDFEIKENDRLIYMVSLDKKEKLQPVYDRIISDAQVTCAFYADNYTDCNFMECMSTEASKGEGTRALKSLLGVDRIVAFGDNLNDLPMFEVADECYAVSNACLALKSAADGVIGSNCEDSVVKFIAERFYN